MMNTEKYNRPNMNKMLVQVSDSVYEQISGIFYPWETIINRNQIKHSIFPRKIDEMICNIMNNKINNNRVLIFVIFDTIQLNSNRFNHSSGLI